MKNAKPVTCDDLRKYTDSYNGCKMKKAMTNVYSKTGLGNLAYNTENGKKMQFKFSVDIKTMSATNQMGSGRCWLFAATNVLREIIAKEKNIENFELSQSYLAFWDKFERVNYFLESVIDTADLPADDRTISFIVGSAINDGGQWDMFVNIVKKYGIVPKDAFPETQQSSNTGSMNGFLNTYLKECAFKLRTMIADGADEASVQAKKQEILDKAYSFLVMCYSTPPTEFDFEYVDKDSKYHIEKGLTPFTFRDSAIGNMLDDYVSIIHAPTKDKPYDTTYTVNYLGNVIGAPDIVYLNLEMEEFKTIVTQQLKDGEVVWFGSDCGKYGEGSKKQWDDASFDYELLTGLEFSMTKEQMLDYRESQMNHAMVITGVNIDPDTDKPNRWKIQNSWGGDGANGGYHMASDSWFDKFVYQAVINKKYLGDKVKLLDNETVKLNPWDPMGSLAD